MNYHATETASTAMRQISCVKGCVPPSSFAPRGPLTGGDSVPILMFPSTQRKEVIQCLIPSAVTSLGSPAKLFQAWQQGALSAWTSEHKSQGATGAIPSRLFCASTLCRALDFAPGHFARSSGESGKAVARNDGFERSARFQLKTIPSQRHQFRIFRILLDGLVETGISRLGPVPQRGGSRSSRTRGGMRWTLIALADERR